MTRNNALGIGLAVVLIALGFWFVMSRFTKEPPIVSTPSVVAEPTPPTNLPVHTRDWPCDSEKQKCD